MVVKNAQEPPALLMNSVSILLRQTLHLVKTNFFTLAVINFVAGNDDKLLDLEFDAFFMLHIWERENRSNPSLGCTQESGCSNSTVLPIWCWTLFCLHIC